MKYCKVAAELLKINTVCGMACPIYNNCPLLIIEDASDKSEEIMEEAILKAIEAILRSLNEKN